jgi:hypothetical protein
MGQEVLPRQEMAGERLHVTATQAAPRHEVARIYVAGISRGHL